MPSGAGLSCCASFPTTAAAVGNYAIVEVERFIRVAAVARDLGPCLPPWAAADG